VSDISSDTAIANLSNAVAATMANRFSRVANVIDDFGAAGNGSTNDTTAIQNAVNACAGNAILMFPAGHTYNHSGFTVPRNSQLIIDGTLFLISNSGSLTSSITIQGNNVNVSGIGTINGNASGQTGAGTSAGITNSGNISDLSVGPSLIIANCKNWPFNITNCTNGWLVNCTLSSSGNSVEFAEACVNCHVIGNTVTSIQDEGIAIYGGGVNCSVVDNIVSSCSASGISVLSDSSQPAICNGTKISGNTCYNNGLSGIEVNTGSGANGPHVNTVVTSNHCYENNTESITARGDINFGNALNFICSGNLVHSTNGSYALGIYVNSVTTSALISGNSIYNIGTSGSVSSGIGVQQAPNIAIVGNEIYDNRSPSYMQSGIQLPSGAGANLYIADNNISGVLSEDLAITPAADTYIQDKRLAFADLTFVFYTPSGGSTQVIAPGYGTCVIEGSSAISSLTLTLPSNPRNGKIQRIVIDVTGGVTALTVNTATGTVRYAPSSASVAAGSCLSWQWNSLNSIWYRLQ